MCGITGILRFDGGPVDAGVLDRMTDALAHRGPDGRGTRIGEGYGLGHRRLAILDLAGGAQPMSTPDGRLWITYNGEIYNFRELRAELEQAGCAFRTRSDTEVILHAYARWGADCVKRFRGMFAFCLVDTAERRFLLARDPFGIKPLLYAHNGRFLAFASEFSALRQLPELRLTGNLHAIEWFLRFQYVPGPDTVFNEVRKLPPGCVLEGGMGEGAGGSGDVGARESAGHNTHDAFANPHSPRPKPQALSPRPYWRLDFTPERGRGAEDWLDALDHTLRESVRAHLIADVPVGVFVSGGVDSSLVTWKIRELGEGPRYAFTIGFEDEQVSELPYARQLAESLGIELRTGVAGEDFWDELPKLVSHYGEPFGDNSMIPTWQLARLARRDVPVCLSGDGGDEAFGGYGTYQRWLALPRLRDHWRRLRRHFSRNELAALLWALTRRLGSQRPRKAEWQRIASYTGRDRRVALWRPELRHLVDAPCPGFEQADAAAPRHEMLAYAQHMDFGTYLPGPILTKVDVATMYHGLEARPPLLDKEVVALAARLPAPLRAVPGDGKVILKDLLARLMGPEFARRRKQGFGIPRQAWFLPGRPGRAMLEQVVNDGASGLGEWFDMEGIRRTIGEHSESRDRSASMWLLLVLGLWRAENGSVGF
jgi:asparagine synthase (glutamine-hydrolysing)